MKRIGTILSVAIIAIILFSFTECSKKRTTAEILGVPELSREDFNRIAVLMEVSIYWQDDEKNSGRIDVGELVPMGDDKTLEPYVVDRKLTDAFKELYHDMVEARRLELVKQELDFGRPTLVANDFKGEAEENRELIAHLVAAGGIITELYQEQKGALKYKKDISANDTVSRALFQRNEGPWCGSPKTQGNPFCNAANTFPKKVSDAYPAKLQEERGFCDKLKEGKDAKELLDPFTVVREVDGKLKALPLTAVYGERMKQVSEELKKAAALLLEDEAAFKKYLLAAAKGFETNDWADADEAWVAMSGRNSRWYLRIAPDETYFDPCSEKAGFHMAFAKTDKGALKWQDTLNPLRQEMEDALSNLVGDAYSARRVKFNFPDFIEIILNTGDSHHNLGAIIGQSLPNWGKVAEEGRRRTLVMTNLYEDPDSKRIAKLKAEALLDSMSMKYYPEDKETKLIGIILHEATHNFGPHSDYKVDGKGPNEIFGGRMATVLEELKAQTGALWYVNYLKKKGVIDDRRAKEIYTHSINWCFGHISRGMFTAGGNPKPYSQLSAIQVGSFVNDGALSFVSSTDPKTGETMDRFKIDYEKLPASIDAIMNKVVTIMAKGDASAAKGFIDYYVTGKGSKFVQMKEIEDRLLEFSKASFYYSVLY